MDYNALAQLLFPNVTDTPETLEEKYSNSFLLQARELDRPLYSKTL